MLFWKFFFGLFIAGLIFEFVYYSLVLLFALASMKIAGRPGNDKAEAENHPKARIRIALVILAVVFLFSVYMVCGWAAFVARYAANCSQTPSVEHHWLYYLFGFSRALV